MNVLKRILSILCSMLRLSIVMITALFSALNKILFDNMEVISMSLILRPQLPERDTLKFIDKLRFNNQELENGASIPQADMFDSDEPFIEDEFMIDDDEAEFPEGDEYPQEEGPTPDKPKEDDDGDIGEDNNKDNPQ